VKSKQVQASNSLHTGGFTFERNGTSCAICHTSEGFTERNEAGTMEIAAAVESPTPINCRTCHEIHTTYTEADFALVVDKPVTLKLTGDTIDLGAANLCVSCHQPRWSYDIPEAGGGDYEVTSKRFGPHHGPQSTMLLGLAGYGEFKGSSVHSAVPDGCVTCHMADAYGKQSGDHTWAMSYEYHEEEVPNLAGCMMCHGDIESFDRNGLQTEVEELMAEAKALLVAQGLLAEDDYAITGTYTSEQAGALWNYRTVLEDRSKGVHNPQFTKKLLETTIDALE
jgi:mono/diheme cytochrome c family protein